MSSWHGNVIRITDPLWGNPPVTGEFSLQRTSNAELSCFLCCYSEQALEHTVELPLIWDATTPMGRHCNVMWQPICVNYRHSILISIPQRGDSLDFADNYVSSVVQECSEAINAQAPPTDDPTTITFANITSLLCPNNCSENGNCTELGEDDLTYCGLVTPYGDIYLAQFTLGDILLSDGIKHSRLQSFARPPPRIAKGDSRWGRGKWLEVTVASSHYLSQWWLLLGEVPWHSHKSNFTLSGQAIIM